MLVTTFLWRPILVLVVPAWIGQPFRAGALYLLVILCILARTAAAQSMLMRKSGTRSLEPSHSLSDLSSEGHIVPTTSGRPLRTAKEMTTRLHLLASGFLAAAIAMSSTL